MTTVNWVKWSDERPEESGVYLTYWSDGDVETFRFDDAGDLDREVITTGGSTLLYWTDNVEPPVLD